jgi:lysylphosphatidylglycerol synthetase-like protein (DUF2156 family)
VPAALPPESRPVGQVIAEAIRLYGRHLWLCLPLGLPLAIASPLAFERSKLALTVIFVALAPLFTLAYMGACAIEAGHTGSRRRWPVAALIGTIVFIPAATTFSWFVLAGIVWLAGIGWVVPVLMNEDRSVLDAFRRAVELFRADILHAIGGLAALVLIFVLTRAGMAWLLRAQADNTVRASIFLADLVISPVIFLGSAIVYRDLAARVGRDRRVGQEHRVPE